MAEKSQIFKVSEINFQIASVLEERFSFLWVKGEISNFIAHSSGHWYFSLKEAESQIRAVMFRGANQKLPFVPENGQEILARGRITTYPPRGVYQLNCSVLEIAGEGEQKRKLEKLKQKLKAEGLFDEARKKPLPLLPKHIAVVTSPAGAAVRDILNILRRRFKGLKITVIPALVQGEEAAESLISALKQAERIRTLDLLIISRGGGSEEDLQPFNDEELVRALAACPLPTVSAVGHEIDFTLCDFVADLRAPTPSAAAELAVKNREDLMEKLQKLKTALARGFQFQTAFFREKTLSLQKQLPAPQRLILQFSQRTDELSRQLQSAVASSLKNAAEQISSYQKILQSLNPKQVMQRGFSIVTDNQGAVVKSSAGLKPSDTLQIEFLKGAAEASVRKIRPEKD